MAEAGVSKPPPTPSPVDRLHQLWAPAWGPGREEGVGGIRRGGAVRPTHVPVRSEAWPRCKRGEKGGECGGNWGKKQTARRL